MFPDHCHRRIDVASAADLAAAKALASALGDGVLAGADAGRLDAVVGILGAHALAQPEGGSLLLRRWGRAGVECLAYDRTALPDGASEPREFAAARAGADRFEMHATPGVGIAVLARVLQPGCSDEPPVGMTARVGAVMVVKPGAAHCGDGWFVRCDGLAEEPVSGGLALVVDGVAGDAASAAAARRIEAIVAATAPGLSPQMVIGAIRRDFANAVGTTAAILRFDGASVDYTALGTVAGAVVRQRTMTSLAARWAMVGYNPQVPASVHLLWMPGDHVVLHSDGCERLPILFIERDLHRVDPTLAAVVLLRDGLARDDDQTVVVLRNIATPAREAAGRG